MKRGIEVLRLRMLDVFNSTRMGHWRIRRKIMRHFAEQKKHWKDAYVQGYFYQGLEDIGIYGAKPTRFRFEQYQVDDILKGADVLDIGSNTGFVAIYCAKLAKSVVGIEFNPYLNRVARDVADYLQVSNAEFIDADFAAHELTDQFDVVLSLSNHHTIDSNLDLGFENHVVRISNLLRPNGVMLFESHNVFASGEGGPGDDGDMDTKVKTISKYFQIERYRMVRCFLKYGDIDKLFIVARKTETPKPVSFELATARLNYDWTEPDAQS